MLAVLSVAARWGRPDLSTKALDVLPELLVPPQGVHLVSLLEAYVNAGRLPEAIKVLALMRSAGLTPSTVTAEPITNALISVDLIDQAFYSLEDMHRNGEVIDIVALNCIILASVRLGDIQRVRATQVAAADLSISPDVDTFNAVLSGCIAAQHRPLGDTILSEMTNAGITPNQTTYESMIRLCLGEASYEDAFFYLETMKSSNFKPSYSIYQAMIRRCISAEDRRWRLVKEEMESLGYEVDKGIQKLVNRPGQTPYESFDDRKSRDE